MFLLLVVILTKAKPEEIHPLIILRCLLSSGGRILVGVNWKNSLKSMSGRTQQFYFYFITGNCHFY